MNIRIIPFFLILIIWGCTNLEFSRQYQPQEFQVLQEFDLDFVPDKCIYLDVDNILFALQKNSNQIYIFRDGAQINIIGGIGSEAAKFNQLCDIALSPDGKLLALDSFQKKIKKFDKDGKFITSINLIDFKEPKLFDITIDETFYIYDEFLNEIIATRNFNQNNWFNFGGQQLKDPSNLTVNMNQIVVSQKNSTLIYNKLGQLEDSFSSRYLVDREEFYLIENNTIRHESSNQLFIVSNRNWSAFINYRNISILLADKHVLIGRFIYEIN